MIHLDILATGIGACRSLESGVRKCTCTWYVPNTLPRYLPRYLAIARYLLEYLPYLGIYVYVRFKLTFFVSRL